MDFENSKAQAMRDYSDYTPVQNKNFERDLKRNKRNAELIFGNEAHSSFYAMIHAPTLNYGHTISKEKMEKINPDINVKTYAERVVADNIVEIIDDYSFIIDATDNFATKFLINDACVKAKKAFSHAGILRFEAQTMTYIPGSTCYRCIFNNSPPEDAVPTGAQAGIFAMVPGIIGTIQAAEAVKFLGGIGDLLTNQLLVFNAKTMEFRKSRFKPNSNCLVCGSNSITE